MEQVDLDEFLTRAVRIFGNIVTNFAEMKGDRRKRATFARKAYGSRAER